MDLRGNSPLFFATDLTNFLACRHLTALERLVAGGLAKRPFFDDPMLEILRERGLEHERSYVQHLAQSGRRVAEINRSPTALDETMNAMRGGLDVIVQARLEHGAWAGWADVLLRVPGESRFGAWRYEPVETKLAKETRDATLIQLCLYADLLAKLQGSPPALLRVAVPERNFEPECYRFEEFRSYFRLVRRNFEAEIKKPLAVSVEAAAPYPEPVAHCDICNWYSICEKRWTKDDHVSLVAGIRKAQRKEFASWGVTTLTGLAQVPPVRIYSQKQLFDLAKDPNALFTVIDDTADVRGGEIARACKEAETKYLSLCADARSLRTQAAELPPRRAALEDVRRKIEVLQQGGHAETLNEYRSRRRQDGAWTSIQKSVTDAVAAVDRAAASLTVPDLDTSGTAADDQAVAALSRAHGQTRSAVLELRKTVLDAIGSVRKKIEDIGSGADIASWRTAIAAKGGTAAALCGSAFHALTERAVRRGSPQVSCRRQ